MAYDPMGARAEMKALIAAQLRKIHALAPVDAENEAETVVSLFSNFDDDWDALDTTTFGYNGRTWTEVRYLTARMPVQSLHFERPTTRFADGAS